MPAQAQLDFGWTVNNKGTYLVTKAPTGVRCQHWADKDARAKLLECLGHNDEFLTFADDFLNWMFKTFPYQSIKGKAEHLKEEIDELLSCQHDRLEAADVFMLSLAVTRLAGHGPKALLEAAKEKLVINKKRRWSIPNSPDDPVHHIKE